MYSEREKTLTDDYYLAHREQILLKRKEHYRKNKELVLVKTKMYAQTHPEKMREYRARWARKNPGKIREYQQRSGRRQYLKHREERIIRQQLRWNDPRLRERHNFLRRQRYALNPLPRLIAGRSRDARLRGGQGDITLEEWNQLLLQFGFRCAYCGITTTRLTMDHVLPISKGGRNTKDNIIPACQSCNSSKGTKTVLLNEIGRSIQDFVIRGESGQLLVPLPKPVKLNMEVV